ncbi:hypothetical protein ABPG77_011126 [Micractinium sp. CCAP 211/92]
MLVQNDGAPTGSGKRGAGSTAGGGGKRRRSDGPATSYEDLLGQGGCCLVSGRDGHEYEVEDPRKLRRLLEQRLTLNAELRSSFLEGLQEQLDDAAVLHAALRPMAVTGGAPITGDSFIRVLLNVTALQAEVSGLLLQRLPEFNDAEGEEAPLPALILGQFRWLDHVADPQALNERLLEVLAVCPEHVRRDAITFLPEVATEDKYDAVIDALEGMMGEDGACVLPCIEAFANLCLTTEQQRRVVETVLERLQSAEAEDLPAVARFLLQFAAPGACLNSVVTSLRQSLHFVCASDPRIAVPDRKGKAAVPAEGEGHPEQRMLEALRQAMQLSPAAGDAVVRELRSLQEPEAHRIVDFWLLMALLTLGTERKKAAEAVLQRKFAEGHAQPAWMQKSIAGHERAMLDFFPQLLALAQLLLRSGKEPVREAGAALYCCLFQHFTQHYNQQEVLRTLHSHLGAQVPAEASAALGVLVALARQHTAQLMRYAAFLTNILDYIDGYTDQQVHQVFVVFGELVAGACQAADSGSSGGTGGRSRMEDELMIFVRKQLSSAQGRHRRIGIIGSVALVQRLGAADSSALESESAMGARYREAMTALKDTFDSCKNSPEAFAFLCDELSRSIQRKAIGRRLMGDLHALVACYLEDTFCCFFEEGVPLGPGEKAAQVGMRRLPAELWWNLDGSSTPCALRMLPLLAEELAPGSKSAPLLALFATMRLTALLEEEKAGNLEGVVALLGCPLSLFEQVLASPQQFGQLPPEERRCVLLGLWYALNWCHELVNCFATELTPAGDATGDQTIALKLLGRLRCCCQLEALLDTLLQFAPPLFALPPLGSALDSSPGGLAAGAAAAAPKKAAAKGGKKKGVKFASEDNASDGAGGGESGPAGSGAATSQRTQRTTSGTVSGGAVTQSGAGAAAQAVSAAAAGGSGRIAAERGKQRSLMLPALRVLGVGAAAAQEQPCYAMLPSAAYILADLHGKLKLVLASSKRPSFLGRGRRQQLPPDLADLTPTELLAALAPVLPCIRRHLDAGFNALDQELDEGSMEQHDSDNFWSLVASGSQAEQIQAVADAGLAPLDIPAARAALSPMAAASRVRTLVFDCVRQLLLWPGLSEAGNRPVLRALLAAFHKSGPQAEWDVMQAIKTCATHFMAQLPAMGSDQPTTDSPSHQHACLVILDALATLLDRLNSTGGLWRRTLQLQRVWQRGVRITCAAEAVLQQACLDEDGKDTGGAAWKGRGPLLADVLRLYLCHRQSRGDSVAGVLQAVLDVASDSLTQVTERTTGKDAAEPVEPFPSLSGATLSVWYRVCFEQLQVAFERAVESATGLEKLQGAKMAEAGREVLEPIQMGMKPHRSRPHMQSAAAAFLALLNVIKGQPYRVPLHVQAMKSGGKFLETLLRVLPFWARLFTQPQHQTAFRAMVKDVQMGTRTLQALCSEGKYHKAMAVTSRVPALKRTVERFVFSIKVFLTGAGGGGGIKALLSTLKNRDLAGRDVSSQYVEEDEDMEGEEDGEYDEEMGETQCSEG